MLKSQLIKEKIFLINIEINMLINKIIYTVYKLIFKMLYLYNRRKPISQPPL